MVKVTMTIVEALLMKHIICTIVHIVNQLMYGCFENNATQMITFQQGGKKFS
jgi:hypothetical protein